MMFQTGSTSSGNSGLLFFTTGVSTGGFGCAIDLGVGSGNVSTGGEVKVAPGMSSGASGGALAFTSGAGAATSS